jgi:hypothetical protein
LTTGTLAVSTVYTLAHGLGSQPVYVFVSLLCDSDEGGWVAGDEIFCFPNYHDGVGVRGPTVGVDATNVTVVTGARQIVINNKSTAASVTTTMNKWKIRVRVM